MGIDIGTEMTLFKQPKPIQVQESTRPGYYKKKYNRCLDCALFVGDFYCIKKKVRRSPGSVACGDIQERDEG